MESILVASTLERGSDREVPLGHPWDGVQAECIWALREVASRLDRVPTQWAYMQVRAQIYAEWRDSPRAAENYDGLVVPDMATLHDAFGSFQDALVAAGLRSQAQANAVVARSVYSEDELVLALRTAADEIGCAPLTKEAYSKWRDWQIERARLAGFGWIAAPPPAKAISRRLGGWKAACRWALGEES